MCEDIEDRKDETDIERYSGLMMKSIAQSTTKRRIGSCSDTSSTQWRHRHHQDLELGGRLSRSGTTDLSPASLMGSSRIVPPPLGPSGNHGGNEVGVKGSIVGALSDGAGGSHNTHSNPRLAAFSFSSLKLNSLMSRLFGSHQMSGSSNEVGRQGTGTPSDRDDLAGVSSSSSTGFGLKSTANESFQSQNEKTEQEDSATSRNQRKLKAPVSRPGGILSNLLKLQALSIPPPPSSHRHRKRRRARRGRTGSHQTMTGAGSAGTAARKQKSLRKSSLGSELLPPSSSNNQILRTSRNASVISLPGLFMAAPSGVGFAPQTMPSASSVGGGGRGGGGVSSPAVATASSSASAVSAEGSLYLRSSPSVFAAATAILGLQPPSSPAERSSLGAAAAAGTPGRERRESTQYLQTTPQGAHSTRSSISADDSTSIYSGISHNPQLEALRLHQQAELAEVLADIMLRQDLLIRLCKSLIRYGAPSHRIELAMEAMCKTFGIDGSFAFLPGLMMISFGDSDTHTSETHLIKCAQGFDMGRLAKVNKIARAVVYGDLEPAEALAELKSINNEKPPYGIWVMLASFAVSSGLIAPLVFKGSWYDMLAGMGLGSVVGLTSLLASRYSVYSNVFEVSTSIVIAFVAKALRDYVCFTGVVLSGIVTLLPGLSLTTAIMELSSRYMISGSVRMFYSLIYCLFLGFGLSIGSNLWDVFKEPPPGDLKMGYCHPATEPWRWVLFPILAIAFNIQLYATPKQWPVMIVCSSVGYAVSEFAGLYWPHSLHIAAAVSAFVVGLLGNIYERLTHELGAILLIVPGGMGVRSSLLLLDQSGNAAQGTAFALQMIIVALGIAVGLFASTLIVYPLGKKRNALLTF
ncbi:hypothetical protein BGZ95_009535 [Linnemannia exigua]|uniref:Threonine/serine exporter-like N-terminal domain-containing protein n=1 Tax=Linnemannia exigua TaxID=604196 RepID=A0AAD4HBL0_9FUNG|nr:hypothetical protein BGZ95_009535 [Linnemannia exigua]